MKLKFLVDYEILQKEGTKEVRDLCLNRDGLLGIYEVNLSEAVRCFTGEDVLSFIVTKLVNLRHNVERVGKYVVFWCNFIKIQYCKHDSDKFEDLVDLEIPDSNLLEFYQKYSNVFEKVGTIINDLI